MIKFIGLFLASSFLAISANAQNSVPALPDASLPNSSSAYSTNDPSATTNTDDVSNNVLTGTMCNTLKIVSGNAGKAFAAFAIISVGIGFFTGKVSWSLMISVAAGIAAMFGAPSIVSAITDNRTYNCGS